MRVRFNKKALRFLEKLDKKKEEKIHSMLKKLTIAAEEGLIPFAELKTKKT